MQTDILGNCETLSFLLKLHKLYNQHSRAFAPFQTQRILGSKKPRQVPASSKGLLMVMQFAQLKLCCEEFRKRLTGIQTRVDRTRGNRAGKVME